MREVTYIQAIAEAQREEMARDPSVILIGEDVCSGAYGTSLGFLDAFGPDRVIDTPISEESFTGVAVGAAMTGLRPIVDYGNATFAYLAFDQLINQAAKSRYMFGGQTSVPVVYRGACYYGAGNAAQHSDRPYPMLMGVPGIKTIVPSTPYDVKGLLKAAIRDDNPVFCFEDLTLLGVKGQIPNEDYVVPIGQGEVKREGDDVTVVGILSGVQQALAAADEVAKEGISVEVIDPRTLAPLDIDLILGSVEKTGRLVIVDPANKRCSAASEIAASVAEFGFRSLKAPIIRVASLDVHVPFSPALEPLLYPTKEKVVDAIRNVLVDATLSAR